jgi:hypothetical protein
VLAADAEGIAAVASEAGDAGEDAAMLASGADASEAAGAAVIGAGSTAAAAGGGGVSSAFLLQAPSVTSGTTSAIHNARRTNGGVETLFSFDIACSW